MMTRKHIAFAALGLALASFSSSALAQEGTETRIPGKDVPGKLQPGVFEEGTETTISQEDLADLLPWAQNSKISLEEALRQTAWQGIREQKSALYHVIKDTVIASMPKQTELLMRYVLNRAVVVSDILDRERAFMDSPGLIDQQVRILRKSAEFALRYYQNDLDFLNGTIKVDTDLPHARFGLEYGRFLIALSESVLDASAEYEIMWKAMAWTMVELNKDSRRLEFAPAIARLNTFLKRVPESSAGIADRDLILKLRTMRREWKSVENVLAGIRI